MIWKFVGINLMPAWQDFEHFLCVDPFFTLHVLLLLLLPLSCVWSLSVERNEFCLNVFDIREVD
jgi:hypothetical protein